MIKFLAVISMLALTNVASAQFIPAPANPGPYCAPSALLIGELLNEFQEVPMLTATNDVANQTLVLFANQKTTTWTIVIFNADMSTGCAVTSGKNYKPFNDQDFEGYFKEPGVKS